jgi:hypothetical protein
MWVAFSPAYALDDVVVQQGKIDSCEERFVFAKQHWRQSPIQFVDLARKQVLANCGDAAADTDVFSVGRSFCLA